MFTKISSLFYLGINFFGGIEKDIIKNYFFYNKILNLIGN